jgi:hypothetical protein
MGSKSTKIKFKEKMADRIPKGHTLARWVRLHRGEIDAHTKSPIRNDVERRMWVLNDEYLYLWAKSERVRGI